MTPRWTQWAEELLLPLMYWQEQLRRTRCPGQKTHLALVLQAVEEAFEWHPCTRQLKPELLAAWKAWAAEHARRSIGPRRRLRDATAISRRCSTTIAACPRVAIRCGRRFITLIAGSRTGRHRRRGFSGGRFPIRLRACCHRSTSCPCPGNVGRPSRQVIEGAECPGLSGYPGKWNTRSPGHPNRLPEQTTQKQYAGEGRECIVNHKKYPL